MVLSILGSVGIPPQLFTEDTMDQLVALYKHVLQKAVFPALDDSHLSILISKNESTAKEEDTLTFPGSASKPRRRSSVKKSKVNPKFSKFARLRKKLLKLVPLMGDSMELWHNVLLNSKLQDRMILHLTTVSFPIFLLEHSSSTMLLQMSAIVILQGIFQRYGEHQELLFEELFTLLSRLPTAKKNLRTFQLHESSETIQVVSALILSLLQSSIVTQGEEAPETLSLETPHRLGVTFVHGFLSRCARKDEDTDFKVLMQQFTDDLLTVFARPEWPAAETVLGALSVSLASVIATNLKKKKRKSLESLYSLMALDILGKICAAIRTEELVSSSLATGGQERVRIENEHYNFLNQRVPSDTWKQIDKKSEEEEQDDTMPEISRKEEERQVVLQHALLSYLSDRSRIEPRISYCRRYMIIRFTSHLKANSPLSEYWKSQWSSTSVSVNAPEIPNHELACLLSRELCGQRVLFRRFDRFLAHIMALLSQGQPTLRARVIKTLMTIVDVDPMLMANKQVKAAVSRCFTDEGISVRQAAVDLVGRYVILQPNLIDEYYDRIAERMRDTGVSVRKKVVRILKELLMTHRHRARPSESMRKMVERIGDPSEESSIKQLIMSTFEVVWFNTKLPVNTSEALTSEACPRTPHGREVQTSRPKSTPNSTLKNNSLRQEEEDIKQSVYTLIDVVDQSAYTVDWLVKLLQDLIYPNGDDSENSKSTPERKKIMQRAEDFTSTIMECLLQIEEGNFLPILVEGNHGDQLFACLKTLHVLGQAHPQLLRAHVETLRIYLKGDEDMERVVESKILSTVAEIIAMTIPIVPMLSKPLINELEIDLKRLVYAAPPSVVEPCIKSLAALVEKNGKAVYGTSLKLLFTILQQFYAYLVKFQNQPLRREEINTAQHSSLQRSLFAVGLICCSVDLDTYSVGVEDDDTLPPHLLRNGQVRFIIYVRYNRV